MKMDYRGYRIVLVDGFAIRNTLDDDFGIVHRHVKNINRFAPKFYIPEGEIWLDAPFQDEVDFLLKTEFFHEDNGLPKDISHEEERRLIKEKLSVHTPIPPFEKSREASDGIYVVTVDGALVRRHIDPEFIFGGHHFVYDYIPEKELWLDAKMDKRELPYIFLHEQYERALMVEGKSYESAHDFATAADKEARRRDGVGKYPTDPGYPWRGMLNEEIIKKYYVVG